MAIYLGLFLSAFASATLLPGSSEVLLVALLTEGYRAKPLTSTSGQRMAQITKFVRYPEIRERIEFRPGYYS